MYASHSHLVRLTSVIAVFALAAIDLTTAQAQLQRRPGPNGATNSVEIAEDRRVTFRIYAPKADEVSIGGDFGQGGALTKDDQGIWSITVGPLTPDLYIYIFYVDGVRTLDPQNPMVKPGISSTESLLFVPGEEADFEATKSVPHGEVRAVWYESKTLDMPRRMHVYTPPGYEGSSEKYPVFYLLHGGGDDDSGWSSIGRAGFILDNLIAEKKAVPMIVVMPNGSLPRPTKLPARPAAGQPASPEFRAAIESLQQRFTDELLGDVASVVEKTYRVKTGPENRALAGLSMGGGQTLRVLTRYPEKFAYFGIWSAGLSGPTPDEWQKQNESFLAGADRVNDAVKRLEIVVGDQDFALNGSRALADMFEKRGIKHHLQITGGGHTWINWRRYLRDFAPRLFVDTSLENGVAGRWHAQFDTQIGVQNYIFDLKVDGGQLSGTATAQIGDEPQREPTQIRNGKLDGNKISFVELLEFNDMELTITYTGAIKEDELHLTRQVGQFATEQLVARRSNDAGAPAVRRDKTSDSSPAASPSIDQAPADFDAP